MEEKINASELNQFRADLERLNKMMFYGNGKKSLCEQVSLLNEKMETLDETLKSVQMAVTDLNKFYWKTIGVFSFLSITFGVIVTFVKFFIK